MELCNNLKTCKGMYDISLSYIKNLSDVYNVSFDEALKVYDEARKTHKYILKNSLPIMSQSCNSHSFARAVTHEFLFSNSKAVPNVDEDLQRKVNALLDSEGLITVCEESYQHITQDISKLLLINLKEGSKDEWFYLVPQILLRHNRIPRIVVPVKKTLDDLKKYPAYSHGMSDVAFNCASYSLEALFD